MKTKLRFLIGIGALGVLAVLSTGCGTAGNILTRPGTVEVLRPAQTNYVTVTATNIVTVTNTVNGVETVTATPVITASVQPVILPAITFTNTELTGIASGAINAAGVAGVAAGVPFAPAIAQGLLAVIGLALSWLAVRRKRQLQAEIDGHKETAEALALAEDVGKTLVLNLEQLRKTALSIPGYTPQLDNQVMTVIQQVQAAAGVKGAINDLVDEHTGFTLGGETAPSAPTAPVAPAAK